MFPVVEEGEVLKARVRGRAYSNYNRNGIPSEH
jgi:hypothetical protein